MFISSGNLWIARKKVRGISVCQTLSRLRATYGAQVTRTKRCLVFLPYRISLKKVFVLPASIYRSGSRLSIRRPWIAGRMQEPIIKNLPSGNMKALRRILIVIPVILLAAFSVEDDFIQTLQQKLIAY